MGLLAPIAKKFSFMYRKLRLDWCNQKMAEWLTREHVNCDIQGSNPTSTPIFFLFSTCFMGIYRRTFTLLSDQGLVAKSIG